MRNVLRVGIVALCLLILTLVCKSGWVRNMVYNPQSPAGSMTPEAEEELRAYAAALRGQGLGPTDNVFFAGSPLRIGLGALQGIQHSSALSAAEANRAGRRDRATRALPGVVPPGSGPSAGQTDVTPSGNASTAPNVPPTTMAGAGDVLHPSYLAAIQRHEGFRDRAYWDHRQWSIGYGTRASGPNEVITREEAQRRFAQELTSARNMVQARFPRLSQGQLAALTSLTYNAGAGWMDSGLGQAVQRGDWQRAGAIFRQYVNASGQPHTGLISRRNEEANWLTHPDPGQTSTTGQAAPAPVPGQAAPSGVVSPETALAAEMGVPGGGAGVNPPSPQAPPVTTTSPASPVAPSAGIDTPAPRPGEPGYFAQGLPPGVPRRIEPSPQLMAVIQRLRDPNAVGNEAAFQALLTEYQRLSAPVERETPLGKATYNPLTGELADFIPSGVIRRPVSAGGASTEEFLLPNAGGTGLQTLPIGPGGQGGPPGTVAPGTTPPGSPNITPRLPRLSEGADINELATWGIQANVVRDMINKMGGAHADRVALASRAGTRASERINMLQSIAALTDASASTRWTGEALSRWQTQVAQFLTNFDPRSQGQRPEILSQLGYRELLQKLNAFLASEATQDISARGTNFEFATLLANNPNLMSSYEGTQMLVNYMMQEQQRVAELSEMATQLHPDQFPNWTNIVREHYRQNPIYIQVPETRGADGRVSPAMRITTIRIPRVGDVLPDGRGTYTRQQVQEFIRGLPLGTWFIDPVTKTPIPAHPRGAGAQ